MRKLPITLFLIICGILAATPVWAVETGGKVELNYLGSWDEDGTYADQWTDSLDLELYLSPQGKTETQLRLSGRFTAAGFTGE